MSLNRIIKFNRDIGKNWFTNLEQPGQPCGEGLYNNYIKKDRLDKLMESDIMWNLIYRSLGLQGLPETVLPAS